MPRNLIRVAYRDPEHISERLTLRAAERLAAASVEWAGRVHSEHPQRSRLEVARALGTKSAKVAGTQGLVAGTPFYVALVPGYFNYLWQEARMTLRLAALYGHDPGTLHAAAEALWLRGVYPTVEAAEAGLHAVRGQDLPPKPERRRPLRLWIRSARRVLIFGGFMSPSTGRRHSGFRTWLRDAAGVAVALAVWVVTWVFPVTFMVAMAWGCESHSRRLFHRALHHYSRDDAAVKPPPRDWRQRLPTPRETISAAGLALSIAVPVGFLAYAIHVRNTVGINWITGLGLLVALSLVLAAAVYGSRR